ncbi:endolytic transglycosylase MltG [Paenibacillus lemnae]|uniref:Endolytic transglycosylase MltG n=1 Tax=Paenibacillus lemnae TaxID=1330551 RepID=A0A848M5F6_PAELE|nr:endolytic transglycosylase MltG [Paenibacillus lemnae]NMO96187.1 hypothetical protein [Paenibacillus lemnae]
MIKNRIFWNGLGLGLILGAVLLQFMILGERGIQPQEPAAEEWSREELERAAETLNLQVNEVSEELLTEEQWAEKQESSQQAEEPQTPDKPKAPEAGTAPKASTAPKATVPPKNSEAAVPKAPTQPKEANIQYNIRNGSHLKDVAAGLKEAGVIDDEQAFIAAATKKKINLSIQQGMFTFKQGESFDSIISKISNKAGQ